MKALGIDLARPASASPSPMISACWHIRWKRWSVKDAPNPLAPHRRRGGAGQDQHVVLGLPRNMDGSYGAAAEKTRAFAEKLRAQGRLSQSSSGMNVSPPWPRSVPCTKRAATSEKPHGHRPSRRADDPPRLARFAGLSAPRGVPTERLRLLMAYDGRPFAGWQSQAQARRAGPPRAAFAAVLGETVRVHGAGRTDAGVHALAHDRPCRCAARTRPPRPWPRALNAHLHHGVRVLRATRAAGFPRAFRCHRQNLHLRVWNPHAFHPLETGHVWHVPGRSIKSLCWRRRGCWKGHTTLPPMPLTWANRTVTPFGHCTRSECLAEGR